MIVPKGPIYNKSTLAQVMAWCQIGYKPLLEPILMKIYNTILTLHGYKELMHVIEKFCNPQKTLPVQLRIYIMIYAMINKIYMP